MAKSPAVILYDSNGVAMAVEDGVAIPVGTQALLAAGSDGTDAHFILTDSAGSPVVVGSGVAGTPAGGVLSVQGVAGGTAIPISGTVSATNPSVSTNNSAAPGSSTQIGGSDGTNLQAARIFDADTGGGTQYVLGAILRKAASGGSVEAGTSSDPLRVDPTGTTTQPISAASLPLPTGAATEATLSTRLADATFTARINTLGQKTMANSTPVVLASDQSSIPVSTTLEKAEDSPASSGDPGVQVLGVYRSETADVGVSNVGDYASLNIDQRGRLKVNPGAFVVLDPMTSTSGWTVLNDDAANLTTTTNHILGTAALTFDKVNGTADTPYAIIQKTISAVDLSALTIGVVFIQAPVWLPSLSNVRNVILRLGTDSSNYNEWSISTSDDVAQYWNVFRDTVGQARISVGNGWDISAVTYIAVGVEFLNQSNTLAGIVFDHVAIIAGHVGSNATTEVSTAVNTANVNLHKVGGTVTDTNSGAASNGTLRVTVATSDVVAISAASLPLPTGAATEATLATRLADATFTARINTLGQKTMANSTPVVLSSDQSAVAISAASLPLPTGAATSANQTTLGNQTTKINDGTNTAAVKAASTAAVATDPALVVAISPNNTVTTSNASVGSNNAAIPTSSTQVGGSDGTNLQAVRVFDGDTGGGTQYVLGAILRKSASGGSVEAGTSSDPLRVDPTGTTAQPVTDNGGSLTVDTTQLPGALVGGRLDINNGAWLGSTAPTVGQKTMANSVPTVIASDQTALPVNVVGAHANLWNNAATGTNGNSTAIDTLYTPHITVFGNTNNSTTMSIQASQDNTNFYTIGTFSAPAGDFGSSFTCGARYIRLQSSNNRTVTATLAGKD